MGTLTVLEGSNNDPKFERIRKTYGQMDAEKVNLTGTGWLTTDPEEFTNYGNIWKTTDFLAGDILIFTMTPFFNNYRTEKRPAGYGI